MFVVFALFLLAAAAVAAPVPPGRGYPYRGQSAMISGYWGATTADETFIGAYSEDGWIGHRLIAGESSLLSFLTRADSFFCLGPNTFAVVSNGSYFLTGTVTRARKSVRMCSIVMVDGDILRFAEEAVSGGRCPDVADLPTGTEPEISFGPTEGMGASRRGILKRIPSSIPTPANIFCVNRTESATTYSMDLPGAPPAIPVGAPCANYTAPGGSPILGGTWLQNIATVGGKLVLDSPAVGGSLEWSAAPSQMILTTYRHMTHSCSDAVTSSIASFNERRTLSLNTTAKEWVCNVRNRVQSVDETLLYVRSNTSEFEGVYRLVQSLPGQENATVTCPLASCIYNGDYRIKPTYPACRDKYLSFSKAGCSSTAVSLRTFQQADVSRLSWTLSHEWNSANRTSTEAAIAAQRNCTAKNLVGPSTSADGGVSPLALGTDAVKWGIEADGKDCNKVNLYSMVGLEKMYLTMSKNCTIEGTSWSNVTSAQSAFELRPAA